MAHKTIKKKESARSMLYSGLKSAIGSTYEKDDFDSDIWVTKPVNIIKFCNIYVREPLFPLQAKFCLALTGKNPLKWSAKYTEGHAFWGKGSGKDRTIAKLQTYMVYKLLCMRNPQQHLREKYGCSIADNDNMDLGNMSINARQARNVFFKKFKAIIKRTKNPKTGKNWFAEQGVDLRDGYDLQEHQVTFPNMITAHSLNSDTATGEGLNLFFTTVDEFGEFATEKGFALLEAIQDTTTSRFNRIGKVGVMSYMYKVNDPMYVLYHRDRDDKDIYSSRAATFEVNPFTKKSHFSKQYRKNPEKAKRTYECKGKKAGGSYITKKYLLKKAFDNGYNPIVGNLVSVEYSKLMSMKLDENFRGDPDKIYAVRFDLGTGKKDKKNDCAGFALVHPELMTPKLDDRLRKELLEEGIHINMTSEEIEVERKGVVADMAFQIVARPGDEIQFSVLRKFVIQRLKEELGFNIAFISYDQWQSRDSIQIMESEGIESEEISVDRDSKPYDDWKELIYQQLFKTYPNQIAYREASELEVNEKGKIDHPDKSWERAKTEDIEIGSKDVTDAISGASKQAYEKIPVTSEVFFG